MTQREAVYRRDGGRCVGCGGRQSRGDRRGWAAHHVLKAQWLRRRGVPSRYLRTELVCVLLCARCHERHEARVAPVPLERLPVAVVEACDALGTWAIDLLRRYHPPTGTAAAPRLNEGSTTR